MTSTRTPSQTVGPFFAIGLSQRPQAELAERDAPNAIRLVGTVFDGDGVPIPDAVVELWQATADGSYDGGQWGRCGTGKDGSYEFVTYKPGGVGDAAPHIAVHVLARGLLRHLTTRIYFPDEAEANAADRVLSSVDADRRETLVAVQEDGALRFDVRLQGDRETVFFAL